MAGGLASLQMYARAETQGAQDRLWHAIRAHYGQGDGELTHCDPIDSAWDDPDLLLSQTCGMPYRHHLKDRVTLVGTPDYAVEGCAPGYYRSCILARRDDPRQHLTQFAGATLAVNSTMSQSGWAAVENHLADTGAGFDFRANMRITGGHMASARAVAQGHADLASIDAVTWRFLQRYEPWTADLTVIQMTAPTPGLPLITRAGLDPAPLFDAISNAIADLSPDDQSLLALNGLTTIAKSAYLAVPLPAPYVG